MTDGFFRCGHSRAEHSSMCRGRIKGCRTCTNARRKERRRAARSKSKTETEFQAKKRKQWEAGNDVLMRAAVATGSSLDFLMGSCRWPEITWPRHGAWLAMRHKGMAFTQIALLMGRDHSTICHGVRRAQGRAESDPDFRALVERLAAC